MRERRQLLNVAYRLLGSVTEAEDVVQETFARWYAMSPRQQEAIETPGAWLTTVATRICFDVLGSARTRRERYVGEWIPEPVPTHTGWMNDTPGGGTLDPGDRVTLDESIQMAFLVVLESMTPAERVAFICHDVFRYRYAEIAEIVGRTPAACRQLAASGRRRLRAARTDPVPTDRQSTVVDDFKRAWNAGDVDALIDLLDPDATAIADGGGLATAELQPVKGGVRIAHFCIELTGWLRDVNLVERTVNGQPGLVAQHDNTVVAVYAFEIADNRIKTIWAIRNPDKLRAWTNQAP